MGLFDGLSSGAGSLYGGVAAGGLGLIGGLLTNSANSALASKQDAFQMQMSDTSYQRSVADMKAAGLNPMLMMGSGAGESSPSGAAIPMQNPALGAVTAATSAASAIQSAEAMGAQIKNTNAQAAKSVADAQVSSASAAKIRAETPGAKGVSDTESSAADSLRKGMDAVNSAKDVLTFGPDNPVTKVIHELRNSGQSYVVPPPQNPLKHPAEQDSNSVGAGNPF